MAGSITDILQAADQRIAAARDSIMGVAGGLGGSFGAEVDAFSPGDIDAQIDRFVDGASSLSATLSGPVATALTGGTTLFTARHDSSNQALTDWQQYVTDCDGEYQTFGTAIDTIRTDIGTALATLKNVIDAMVQSVDGVFDGLDQTVTNWNQRLGSELLNNLQTQWQDLENAITQTHAPNVQNLLTASQGDVDMALTQLFETAAKSLEQLASDVGSAFGDLDTHLTDHARKKVQDAIAHLVQEGVEEVLKTIIYAIAKAEIGASITVAMAEILPILIPIKKGAEALLAAIRLVNQLSGRGG